MPIQIPVPPAMLVTESASLQDLEDLALELYQSLANSARLLDELERKTQTDLAEQTRSTRALIVSLASERFEFERLVKRITPELDRTGASEASRLLHLHSKAWDQRLTRSRIEVRDPTGFPLTNELLSDVDVEAALPDSSISESRIHETLAPLVLLESKTIGIAKVVTVVPAPQPEPPEIVPQKTESGEDAQEKGQPQ